MDYYRVSESQFEHLIEYPFQSHYANIEGLRIHYLDEGLRTSQPVLLLHGVPTWSYLYRRMIPLLSAAGYRVIAPDMAGFGKSDKPLDPLWHSLQAHVRVLRQLVITLDLKDITLFGQDWGSMIGLRMAVEESGRFAGIIISNGGLPSGREKVPVLFSLWKMFARWSPWFPIDRIVNLGCRARLSKEQRRAYRAPFPGSKHKAGPRALPGQVPLNKKHPEAILNQAAWEKLKKWNNPFLTLFGDSDTISRGWEKVFMESVPGALQQRHRVIKAGHFIQEDAGPELAEIIINFVSQNKR